jgi:DNA-binding IclR family transcriptional regulator
MKSAPAAMRAMSVISHMTVHPQLAFTLSELSAALQVSPASMSSILQALTDWGFVTRDRRHRTYTLGPAMVAAGHAASARHPVIEAARPELVRLAAFGTECLGSVAVGDDLLILAIEGTPSATSRVAWIGQRIPLLPPFGQVFFAWESEREVADWLAKLGPERAARHRDELLAALERVRSLGVGVGIHSAVADAVADLVSASANRTRIDDGVHAELARLIPEQTANYFVSAIRGDERYDIANLVAPVFGADGRVNFAMTLYGIEGISGTDLLDLRREMLDSGRAVTRAIGGRWPGFPEVVS